MKTAFLLEPARVYADGDLVEAFGVTHAALAQARRNGKLRSVRIGRRTLMLGEWVSDWLRGEPKPLGGQREH